MHASDVELAAGLRQHGGHKLPGEPALPTTVRGRVVPPVVDQSPQGRGAVPSPRPDRPQPPFEVGEREAALAQTALECRLEEVDVAQRREVDDRGAGRVTGSPSTSPRSTRSRLRVRCTVTPVSRRSPVPSTVTSSAPSSTSSRHSAAAAR